MDEFEVIYKHPYSDEIYETETKNIFQLITLAESLVGDVFKTVEEAMASIQYIKETGEELWTATDLEGNLYDIKIFNKKINDNYLYQQKIKESKEVIESLKDFLVC